MKVYCKHQNGDETPAEMKEVTMQEDKTAFVCRVCGVLIVVEVEPEEKK